MRPRARAPRPATPAGSRGRGRADRRSAPGTPRGRSRRSGSRRRRRPCASRSRRRRHRHPGGPGAAIADHLDAGGARAHRQARHRLADHRAQAALGGQLERMDRRLVDQPERRTLDREERGGEVDDVVEQCGQIGPAGDRGGDPSERLIAGDIATGQSARVRLRRLASSSGTSIPTPVRDGHVARGTSCGAFSRRRSHARLSVAGRCLNAPYRRVDRLAIARQS